MTGQQLKNSILQEAIQGRLVSNILQAGEKTGAELLQDILAERQKKENTEKGKKAKKLTLSTIEEEPWELPEGWCWTQISSLAEILNGYAFKSNLYVNSGYRVIRITNVQDGEVIDNDPKYYPLSSKDLIKDYILEEDDLLMSLTGNVGRVGFLPKELLPAALNQRVACIRFYLNNSILKQFVFYIFRSQMFVKDCVDSSKGMAQLNMSTEWLKQYSIPLPPISIQKAIVAKIEELFPLVDEYDKAAGELKVLNESLPDKLRKSVLQEAIHGTLVPNDIPEGEATAQELLQQILEERQDRENKEKGKKAKKLTLSEIEEEPWELPEGWCWCSLSDYLDVRDGTHDTPKYVTSGYPLVTSKNLSNGLIDLSNVKLISEDDYNSINERSKVDTGDILFAMIGSIGNPAIVKEAHEYAIKNVALFKKGNYSYEGYSYYALLLLQEQMKQESSGGIQSFVSLGYLRSFKFPLPPLSIQHRIVEKIEELFSEIYRLRV